MGLRTIRPIAAMVLGLLAGPLPNEAQEAGKVHRIGYLSLRDGFEAREKAFLQGLRELGYIEGENIVVEWRFAKGSRGRVSEIAAELVRLKVDCIVTTNTPTTRAAKKAASTIPIVMVNVGDPVGRNIVASLARPGGNITGLAALSRTLAGKRMELFKETFPQVSRIAALWDSSRRNSAQFGGTESAARALGVQLHSLDVQPPYDLEKALRAAIIWRAEALIQFGCCFWRPRAQVFDFANTNRLPVMYSASRFARAGGLMPYAPDRADQFRQAATYVDKIFKGAKPTDLPVEGPRKFDLVVNLKTAKKRGLTIPSSILYRASEVIR